MSSSLLVGTLPTTVPESAAALLRPAAVPPWGPAAPAICAAELPSSSIRGAPVAMTSPGWPCSSLTTPAKGAGTSTTAFAVSTASMGWSTAMVSPTFTCQRTISASASPSPRSGRLKVVIYAPFVRGREESFRKGFTHSVRNARSVGDVVVLETGQRDDRVVAGYALDRRVQVVETTLRDRRCDFRADATVARRLVNDDEPAGFHDRLENGVVIDWRQSRKIEHFTAHTFAL